MQPASMAILRRFMLMLLYQQEQRKQKQNPVNHTLHTAMMMSVRRAFVSAAQQQQQKLASLRIVGPDQKGIVATTTNLLNQHGCSVVQSEHYTDKKYRYPSSSSTAAATRLPCSATKDGSNMKGTFVQRILFEYTDFEDDREKRQLERELDDALGANSEYGMTPSLDWRHRKKNVGVLVTKLDHCLWELLLRHEANDLYNCHIPVIIANHPDLKHVADVFNVPFEVVPVSGGDTESERRGAERRQLELLREHDVDVVVLARYMQVLSDDFLNEYPNAIINIHHSFLPAFAGGKAYHQAHRRGVKLIGATAHYTTCQLDEGPILEQDVARVSHRDTVADYIRKGKLLERQVLWKALQAHLQDRVTVYDNKCVVFGE